MGVGQEKESVSEEKYRTAIQRRVDFGNTEYLSDAFLREMLWNLDANAMGITLKHFPVIQLPEMSEFRLWPCKGTHKVN